MLLMLTVKRFDRTGNESGYIRARMISSLTVLGADDSVTSRDKWSYILLAEEMRRIVTEPKHGLRELFRRIVSMRQFPIPTIIHEIML